MTTARSFLMLKDGGSGRMVPRHSTDHDARPHTAAAKYGAGR